MSLEATCITHLSDPGIPPKNEDAAGYTHAGGSLVMWVLDGATSVADSDLLGQDVGDVEWFAQTLSDAFVDHASDSTALQEIVAGAISQTANRYRAALGAQTPADHEWPIAAGVLARLTPNESGAVDLEAARLGDCCIFVQGDVVPNAVTGLQDGTRERQMHARVGQLRAQGVRDEAEMKAANLDELRRQRAYLAKPGMGVFSVHPAASEKLILERVSLEPGTALLAMSDGFYRGVELYDAWTDASLIADCRRDGLHSVLRRLRALEDAPDTLDRFPRLKRRDDATALLWVDETRA